MTNRFVGRRYLLFTIVLCVVLVQSVPVAVAQVSSDTYKNVYSGWRWWHVYCYRCHGVDAMGTTNAPGFTDPNGRLTRTEFLRKVRNGVPQTAMQAWNKLLDDGQIAQIYTYVMARTDKVLPP